MSASALTSLFAISSIPTPPPDGDPRSFKDQLAVASTAMTITPHRSHNAGGIVSACAECGSDVVHPYLKQLQEAQVRIAELEGQIQTLTLRATTAMEQATEYETSLRRMNSLSSAGRSTPTPNSEGTVDTETPSSQPTQATASTSPEGTPSRSALARLLPTRMPSLRSLTTSPANTGATQPPSRPATSRGELPAEPPKVFPLLSQTPPAPMTATSTRPAEAEQTPAPEILQARLEREQKLRKAAEADAERTKSEIEELTGSLFEQANKLVADERKARDRLEKRVEVLERRDQEKTKRLGMLDMRVQRIERVRQVLSEKVIPTIRDQSEDRGKPPQRIGLKA